MQSSGGRFSDLRWNLRQLLRSPVAWSWAGLILGIHLLVGIAGGPEALAGLYRLFGLSRSGFLSGRVWQVLTYGFLHGGWWHVGLNAVFVLLLGSRIEFMVGRRAMMTATLAGILAGGLGHLLLGTGLLVGLSGGVMALLLLLTTLSPDSRMFPLPVSGRSLGLGILLAELILTLVDPALGLPGLSRIGHALADAGMGFWFSLGHACHVGGALAGWLYGRWILRPRVTLNRLQRERARREAG